MYVNFVFSLGIDVFYVQCVCVGVDLVLVVDVLVEEFVLFCQVVMCYNIVLIFICLFNVDDDLLCQIVFYGCGYIYLLLCVGVMGVENCVVLLLYYLVEKLVEYYVVLLLQGFGIFVLEQVSVVIDVGVVGVIFGFVIVKIIECYFDELQIMFDELKVFVQSLKVVIKIV